MYFHMLSLKIISTVFSMCVRKISTYHFVLFLVVRGHQAPFNIQWSSVLRGQSELAVQLHTLTAGLLYECRLCGCNLQTRGQTWTDTKKGRNLNTNVISANRGLSVKTIKRLSLMTQWYWLMGVVVFSVKTTTIVDENLCDVTQAEMFTK